MKFLNTIKIIQKKPALILLIGVPFLFLNCKNHDVGYVDSGRLFKEAERFQLARDSIKNYDLKWKKEAAGLDSLVKTIGLELVAAKIKDSKYDSLVSRYNSKQHDFQRFVQASTDKAKKMEVELMVPHLKSTNLCLKRLLIDNKLVVLLGTQQPGTILAGDPKADFTDKAIEYLNTKCKE